jgi:endoglucanase
MDRFHSDNFRRRISTLTAAAWLFTVGCIVLSATPSFAETPMAAVPTETAPSNPTVGPTTEAADLPAEWPDAFEINRRIGRGVNFGNALEAPAEGEWGVTLEEEYFQLVKDAGFTAIRLPVRWNTHSLPASPYTIDRSFFERVDWAVENALSRGMILILDFHHFTDYMECAACQRERLLALWEQIADHYREYPPELVFELLNEPTDAIPADQWNADLAAALGIIRTAQPQRAVVVGPVNWNGRDALKELVLPEDDRGLIVTFHYYEPFRFTHQGADWVGGSDAWLGTEWGGNADELRTLREDFLAAAAWGQAFNRPILLGEFGAYEQADMASRARFTAAVAREAETLSFSWAYWEFCAGFGVYDPAAKDWRMDLLRSLLPESPLLER